MCRQIAYEFFQKLYKNFLESDYESYNPLAQINYLDMSFTDNDYFQLLGENSGIYINLNDTGGYLLNSEQKILLFPEENTPAFTEVLNLMKNITTTFTQNNSLDKFLLNEVDPSAPQVFMTVNNTEIHINRSYLRATNADSTSIIILLPASTEYNYDEIFIGGSVYGVNFLNLVNENDSKIPVSEFMNRLKERQSLTISVDLTFDNFSLNDIPDSSLNFTENGQTAPFEYNSSRELLLNQTESFLLDNQFKFLYIESNGTLNFYGVIMTFTDQIFVDNEYINVDKSIFFDENYNILTDPYQIKFKFYVVNAGKTFYDGTGESKQQVSSIDDELENFTIELPVSMTEFLADKIIEIINDPNGSCIKTDGTFEKQGPFRDIIKRLTLSESMIQDDIIRDYIDNTIIPKFDLIKDYITQNIPDRETIVSSNSIKKMAWSVLIKLIQIEQGIIILDENLNVNIDILIQFEIKIALNYFSDLNLVVLVKSF